MAVNVQVLLSVAAFEKQKFKQQLKDNYMQNDEIKNVQPLLQQHNVSSSCGDTPYTKNTKEIRKFLEEREYFPLRFFQGGEYIYPIVSTMANAQSTWKVKDYSTFDESKKINMPYLMDSPLSEEDFKLAIIKADSNYCLRPSI